MSAIDKRFQRLTDNFRIIIQDFCPGIVHSASVSIYMYVAYRGFSKSAR